MRVVYTESPGKEKGVCYRHPKPFFGVISGATEVIVDGDYPNIVEAYERAGKAVHSAQEQDETDEERDALVEEYEKRTGKKPGRMKLETIREKLDELNQEN